MPHASALRVGPAFSSVRFPPLNTRSRSPAARHFEGRFVVREIPSRLSTLDCELLRVPLPQRTTLYSHEIIDVCASDHYFAHAQAATRALFVRPLAFTWTGATASCCLMLRALLLRLRSAFICVHPRPCCLMLRSLLLRLALQKRVWGWEHFQLSTLNFRLPTLQFQISNLLSIFRMNTYIKFACNQPRMNTYKIIGLKVPLE